MDNRESSEIDYYSDAKTARLFIVDELLRSPQGGTYEEMLQKVDEWPDNVKQRFSVIKGFMDLYETKKLEWDLMEKTIEWLVEIYAFAHGFTIPPIGKESRAAKKRVRNQFISEEQKRKGMEKRFRYFDPSYSVFGSGDYAEYIDSKDKPIVIIRQKGKAIKTPKILRDFQNRLLKEGRAQTSAFVQSYMNKLQARISIDPGYLTNRVPKELELSIAVASSPHFSLDGIQQAQLYFIRALHYIQQRLFTEALSNLKKVLKLCSRYPTNDVAQKLTKEAESLMNSIHTGTPVEVSFERAVRRWPSVSRSTKGISKQKRFLSVSIIHTGMHLTVSYKMTTSTKLSALQATRKTQVRIPYPGNSKW